MSLEKQKTLILIMCADMGEGIVVQSSAEYERKVETMLVINTRMKNSAKIPLLCTKEN